jgi:hypothetical protein
LITAPLSTQIVDITFIYFYTESCCDKVRLYDGNSASSSLLTTVAGSRTGYRYMSSQRHMFVRFTTDSSVVRYGFNATFSVVTPWANCSGTLTASSGTITSPNYPSNYANNALCQWLISGPSNTEMIQFTRVYFYTESGDDYLRLHDGNNASASLITSLSGYYGSSSYTYTSTQRYMFVRFTSDSANVYRGFSATYTALILPDACVASSRPAGLTGSSGTFTSPLYPGYYSNNANCQWLITAPSSDQKIVLQFTYFYTRYYDYVRLHDGNSASASRIASLYGSVSTSNSYVSTQRYMFVTFTSSSSNSAYRGFNATYTAVSFPSACSSSTRPVSLTSSEGSFSSPYFPGNYINNADCQWLIIAPSSDQIIILRFVYFYTQYSYDYVRLHDGRTSSSSQLASLSGSSSTSTSYRSTQRYMFVTFTSSSSSTYRGFNATYSAYTLSAACSASSRPQILSGVSGTISSMYYPSSYINNADCQWLIAGSSTTRMIMLQFTDVYTESCCDKIRLYNGNSTTSPLIASISGSSPSRTPYTSSQRFMLVRFTSDSSVVYRGFQANYTASTVYIRPTCDYGRRYCQPSGVCISSSYICDGTQHCADDSDEVNCTCLSSQYQCQNGRCISRQFVCDGIKDCPLGDDELTTQCLSTCTSSQFQCLKPVSGSHQCISSSQRCDGTVQCHDHSDEHRCVSLNNTDIPSELSANYRGQTGYKICADNWITTDINAFCQYFGHPSAVSRRNISTSSSHSKWLTKISGSSLDTSNPITSLQSANCPSNQALAIQCSDYECGRRSPNITNVGPYIIGGQYAYRGAWPWQVMLKVDGDFWCGGSLINDRWILTAAHCTRSTSSQVSASRYTIRLGATMNSDSDPDAVNATVDRVFTHPSYDSYYIVNDVGLLRLSQPIQFTDTIRPICLPDNETDIDSFKVCVATGFGRTSYYDSVATRMLQVRLNVLPISSCFSSFDWVTSDAIFNIYRNTVICLGPDPRYKTGTCKGDSGGPLACQDANGSWKVIGVTSFGVNYCSESYDARVQAFLPWIHNIINNNN